MPKKPEFDIPRPLLDALVENRWLPLVGAGFSKNAEMPAGETMPTWKELGKAIEQDVRDLTPGSDGVEAISAYVHEHGRGALVQRLRRALHADTARAGAAHRALAHLPFDLVVTTNFDDLVEDGYRAVDRPLHVVVRDHQLADPAPRDTVTLVKAHGDLHNEPLLVATEADYDEFLHSRPLMATYLANLLITRIPVLIGYSLSDPDWRQLLAAVRSRLGRSQPPAYAFEIDPSQELVRRFERRGVKVIRLRKGNRSHGEVYAALFRYLRDYIAQHTLDVSLIRNEAVREALVGSGRPLVLFVVPERLLAYYRAQVFPEVAAADLSPVTPFDVVPAGGSVDAAVLGLLEYASAILVDVTGGDRAFDAYLASSALRDRAIPVAIVAGDGRVHPATGDLAPFVFNQSALSHPELASYIRDWLREMIGPRRRDRPPRPTPTARVIHAYEVLESALEIDRRAGRALVERVRELALPPDLRTRLLLGISLRNALLHGDGTVTSEEARHFERAVATALESLGLG